MTAIQEIFNRCQSSMNNHASLIKSLRKIYDKTEGKEFVKEFRQCVVHILVVFKREPAVERAVDFVVRFSASFVKGLGGEGDNKENEEGRGNEEGKQSNEEDQEEEMHPFVLQLFSFLLEHHNAADRAVRFRVCQMIQKLLSQMGEDATIDDSLYEKIYDCMLIRLRDKFPVVRANAVLALARLQDPSSKDCQITEAYKFLLSCDRNPDVRRAVLCSIAASTRTLSAILERTRDLKDTVRRAAYQVISDKVHVRALTIAQRVRLLQHGLNDRSECVREACKSKMIRSWLSTYNGSALQFLSCLDVENSQDVSQQFLNDSHFSSANINDVVTEFRVLLDDRLCVLEEKLSCEVGLYWRCLCEHLRACKTEQGDSLLDSLLPNALHFTEYFTRVFGEMKKKDEDISTQLRHEFILQQLVSLLPLLDLSDQVCRKRVDDLVRSLLLDEFVPHTLVKSLMTFYVNHHGNDPESCVRSLAEIISDIREPMVAVETVAMDTQQQRQRDMKVASLRVELNELRDELEGCVEREDYSRAVELKQRIAELDAERMAALQEQPTSTNPPDTQRVIKNDSLTLLKCLSIVCGMLTEARVSKLYSSILSIIDSLILPSVQSSEPAVRNVAVRALGLACMRSVEKSRVFMLLFLKVSRLDVETVCVTALKAIFDQLHFYGLDAFKVDPEKQEKNSEKTTDKSKNKSLSSNQDDDDDVDVDDDDNDNDMGQAIMTLLTEQLDSDSGEIRTVCAEGFAKLLLSRRIVSPTLLSRLLLHWYNPVTEDDLRLRHCLGTFLPIYAFSSRENQSVVCEAALPTLRTLFNAPDTSPLSEVKIVSVAELLVELTNVRHVLDAQQKQRASKSTSSLNNETTLQETCAHDDLAVAVANEILSAPSSFNVRVLTRVLTLLELSPRNDTTLKDLKVLTRKMMKVVKDKQCARMLVTFQRNVEDLCSTLSSLNVTQEEAESPNNTTHGICQSNQSQPQGRGLEDETSNTSKMEIEDSEGEEFTSMIDSQRIKRASAKQNKPSVTKFLRTGAGTRFEGSSSSDLVDSSVHSSHCDTLTPDTGSESVGISGEGGVGASGGGDVGASGGGDVGASGGGNVGASDGGDVGKTSDEDKEEEMNKESDSNESDDDIFDSSDKSEGGVKEPVGGVKEPVGVEKRGGVRAVIGHSVFSSPSTQSSESPVTRPAAVRGKTASTGTEPARAGTTRQAAAPRTFTRTSANTGKPTADKSSTATKPAAKSTAAAAAVKDSATTAGSSAKLSAVTKVPTAATSRSAATRSTSSSASSNTAKPAASGSQASSVRSKASSVSSKASSASSQASSKPTSQASNKPSSQASSKPSSVSSKPSSVSSKPSSVSSKPNCVSSQPSSASSQPSSASSQASSPVGRVSRTRQNK